jgi:hypothetical protein
VLALLVALVIAAAVWAWRRRPRPVAVVPATPPRERALAELERIRRSGLLESGRYREFCFATTGVVRMYLADLSADWGTDLTTTELASALRAEPVPLPPRIADAQAAEIRTEAADPAVAVVRLLGAADVLKFTGVRGTEAGVERLWSGARDWVGAYDRTFWRIA